jgi:hypothetical protein
MVRKEARVIANSAFVEWGGYNRLLQRINLNLTRVDIDATGDEYARVVVLCASTIVHEAAHGWLYTRGFPYTKHTRLRVERICRRHERRFVSLLPHSDFTEKYLSSLVEFNAADWEPSWNLSRGDYRRRIVRVFREQWRMKDDPGA